MGRGGGWLRTSNLTYEEVVESEHSCALGRKEWEATEEEGPPVAVLHLGRTLPYHTRPALGYAVSSGRIRHQAQDYEQTYKNKTKGLISLITPEISNRLLSKVFLFGLNYRPIKSNGISI